MSTYNKITIGGTTVLDLSQDTVADASHIRSGYVGHLNDGTQVTGTFSGSGVDCPNFTITTNQSTGEVTNVSCNKTYAQCLGYINNGVGLVTAQLYGESFIMDGSFLGLGDNDELLYNTLFDNDIPGLRIYYKTDGTITWEQYPVEYRSSSDLTASNLTVTAPSGYYASNASKTLTDSNLTAANIKKDVTIFGVTGSYEGSGGGGGLVYETGTYTPASETAEPTISFANSHNTLPMYIYIQETSEAAESQYSALLWSIHNYYIYPGYILKYSSSSNYHSRVNYIYMNSGLSAGNINLSTTGTGTGVVSYYVGTSWFKPYGNSTRFKFRASHTYKWIAVWAPTT